LKSKQYVFSAFLTACASVFFVGVVLAAVTPKPPFNCPDQGSATSNDKKILNKLKNRIKPPPSPTKMTSAEINALPTKEKAKVNTLQNRGVVVEGFLVAAKQQGAESTNCGEGGANADYHLWLVDSEDQVDLTDNDTIRASKGISTVIEITPRWRKVNPGWSLKTLNRLIKQKAKFRVTGWLMLDPEHPDQIGQTRGSIWEIHPITKIEVLNGSKWVEI
jgi:hypothetical protein